jgi:hypothetical protein
MTSPRLPRERRIAYDAVMPHGPSGLVRGSACVTRGARAAVLAASLFLVSCGPPRFEALDPNGIDPNATGTVCGRGLRHNPMRGCVDEMSAARGGNFMIRFTNGLGNSFRLTAATFAVNGLVVFQWRDPGDSKQPSDGGAPPSLPVFDGMLPRGEHHVAAVLTYQGVGAGVFSYMNKYQFEARGSKEVDTVTWASSIIEAESYEKGGPTTPIEDRPGIRFNVSRIEYE